MDINDVKLNWKERTDVLSKMIRTFGKQKTAEQIDGFIDKLIAVEGDEDKELVEFLFQTTVRCFKGSSYLRHLFIRFLYSYRGNRCYCLYYFISVFPFFF